MKRASKGKERKGTYANHFVWVGYMVDHFVGLNDMVMWVVVAGFFVGWGVLGLPSQLI